MNIEVRPFPGVDALFAELTNLRDPANQVAFRGHADSSWKLVSGFDRVFPTNMCYSNRLEHESRLVNEFRSRATRFLGRIEKSYLGEPMTPITTHALMVIQHYGAQTRLLDWTYEQFFALFLAALEPADKDGAVWWFRLTPFCKAANKLLEICELRDPKSGAQSNWDCKIFKQDAPDFISEVGAYVPFPRLETQNGFFTVTGRLGVDHGERIATLFDGTSEKLFKQIIPAGAKNEILDRIERMNLSAKGFDYPGADIVGNAIAATRRNQSQ